MKKILILAVIAIFFVLTENTQAASGGCSYHSGVNCGAGPDWDGSAICNDGWRDSSVSYLSSAECENYVFCTKSELGTLEQKYNVDNLKNQKTTIQSQVNIIYAELNTALVAVEGKPITMQSINGEKQRLISDANSKILPLQYQLDSISSQLSSALDSVIKGCTALGEAKINQLQQQAYASKLVQEQATKEAAQNALLQTRCASNSTLKTDGKCHCSEGSWQSKKGNGCITYDKWCAESVPDSHYKDGECYCDEGRLYLNGVCVIPDAPKTEEKIKKIKTNSSATVISTSTPTKKAKAVSTKPAETIINKATELITQKKPSELAPTMAEQVVAKYGGVVEKPKLNKEESVPPKTTSTIKMLNNIMRSLGNFFKNIKFW